MLAINFERTPIFEFGNQSFNPVDLGLPSGRKWASCNVGAKSQDDCGYMMDFDTANAIEFQDGWHVPSPEDFKELVANCESEWTLSNGVPGRIFKSKINGNSIFLPAAGYRHDGDLDNASSRGYYCLSSLSTNYSRYAFNFIFDSGNCDLYNGSRVNGLSVRPVCDQ